MHNSDNTNGLRISNYFDVSGIRWDFRRGTTSIMSFSQSNNVLINSTNDNGNRLQVTGTMSITGDLTHDAASTNANIVLKSSSSFDSSIYYLRGSTFQWQIKTDASNNLNFFKFQGGAGVVMIIKSSGIINLSNVPMFSWFS